MVHKEMNEPLDLLDMWKKIASDSLSSRMKAGETSQSLE